MKLDCEINNNKKQGQVLVLALVTMAIGSILSLSIISYAAFDFARANKYKFQKQAEFLAEAGLERAIYELTASGGSYTGADNYNDLSTGTYKIVVGPEQIINNQKIQQIDSEGRLPQGSTSATAKHKDKRRNKLIKVGGNGSAVQLIPGQYDVFVDDDGINMANSGTITVNGNTYSNANISGNGGTIDSPNVYAVGTISNPPVVTGTTNPGQSPTQLPFFDYTFWKVAASQGGTISASDFKNFLVTCGVNCNFGPKKIEGDVLFENNEGVSLTGPIYITGDLIMKGTSKIQMGIPRGLLLTTVVVVAGNVVLEDNAFFRTQAARNYIILASTKTGGTSLKFNNSVVGPIVYAHYTALELNGNARAFYGAVKGLNMTGSSSYFLPFVVNSGPNYSGIVPTTFLYNNGSYQKIQ